MENISDNLQQCLTSFRETILPGSIEETSLATAFTMAQQGQEDVARSIITSLLLDDTIKQSLMRCFGIGQGNSQSQTPISSPDPEPDVPAPTPPPAAIAAQENNQLAKKQVETKPVPTTPLPPKPPIVPTPTVTPVTPPTPIAPIPQPTPSVADILESQPVSTSPAGAKETIGVADDVWSAFNSIVEEVQQEPQENKNEQALQQVVQAQEQDAEEKIKPIYDKVFEGESHTGGFQVPGIIKTYHEAADVTERTEREAQQSRESMVLKAQPFFNGVEKYLKKAYEMNDPNVIASAQQQLQSLKERYPYYIEDRAAHIADIHHMIEGYMENQEQATPPIRVGMKISSETKGYSIAAIADGVITFQDESGSMYQVPQTDLDTALEENVVDVDGFFVTYLEN